VFLEPLKKVDLSEKLNATANQFPENLNLEVLILNINKLNKIVGIQDCPKISELKLEENIISYFRDLKNNLPSLKSLSLSKNSLNKEEINLPKLRNFMYFPVNE